MLMKLPRSVLALAVPLLALQSGAGLAADVSWGPPQAITGPADILTDGELVEAVNEGNSSVLVDPGGLNLSFSAANDFPQSPFSSGNLGSGDAGFDTIINEADWGNTNANPHAFSVTGLSVGETYDIQMFVSDIRSCCNGRSMEITGGANTATVYMGDNGGSPSPPQFVVGTFTADATAQSFSFFGTHPSAGNLRHPQLNAYVLQKRGGPAEPTGDHPFISEFVAAGNVTKLDEDGDSPDWIEIYNPTGTDLDLAGYHLTDDPNNLTKWTFPSTPLQAGRYLVVFASDKDRAVAGAELHLNFKLASAGDYLALVGPDGVAVASEFAPAYPPQADGFSYGIGGPAPGDPAGYFAPPSPGSGNGTLLSAPLIAPVLDPPCGTFSADLTVSVTPAFPGASIRYTTNGSVPTAASALYSGPITLSSTTHLRARVFDAATGGGGEIASGAYHKLATTSNLGGINPPSTFTSNLPIMVVENFGAGGVPGPGATLQAARVSVFDVDPASGRSSLAGAPDACFRIGIRRRGQSSSGFAKPQYRVELRDESDLDLDFPLLGLPAESDWVFNGPWTDKALIRNSLSFELGRTIGVEAPRTKHFEMFLSTNGGDLTSSEYVGVYVLLEKIKQGKNRTDITGLSPSDNSEPEVTGGYLTRFEPPGIADDGPRATGWNTVEILEPSAPTTAQRNYLGKYYDDFVATLGWSRGSGANNSGVPNPDPLTGYPAYIDVDSFVNMMIVTELGRDQDAYVRSDYMFKDRGGKLHKGPLWDHNLIMGTGCCFDNRNPMGWQFQDNYNRGGRDHAYEPDWIVPLMRDPDFRQQLIDRWGELRRDGALEMASLFARIDAQADPLAEAAVRNFIKWNNLGQNGPGFGSPSTSTWEEQIAFIKTWLTQRMAWIDGQFPESVSIAPGSRALAAGSRVALSAAGGAVYYTLDGSDPRAPGGGISPGAIMLGTGGNSDITLVPETATGVEALRPSSDSPGPTAWTLAGFDSAGWQTGSNGVGYDYAGLVNIDVGNVAGQQPHSVYIRLPFDVADPSTFNVLTLRVKYDDGFIAYLNGTRIASANAPAGTPAWNAAATGDHPDSAAVNFVDFDVSAHLGALLPGSNLLAIHALNSSGTPNATNTGSGSSDMLAVAVLVAADVSPGGGIVAIDSTLELTARSRAGNDWSAPTTATYVVGTPATAANLAITELNYHPSDPTATEAAADASYNDDDFEFIEVKNVGTTPIDLSGIAFVDGITFTVPATTVLQPGGYGLFVENLAAFEERYGPGLPVLGVYADKLSNDGEALRLVDLSGNDIASFSFNDSWFRPTDGDGFTLVAADEDDLAADRNDPAAWGISCQLLGTPGAPNGEALSYTFASWLNYHFSAAERADQSISGPLSDRDGDGISTLLEFALGLDPNQGEPGKLPNPGRIDVGGNDYLTITFQRQRKALDLRYSVELAGDLASWGGGAVQVGPPRDNGDGTETVTYRDVQALGVNQRRAMRVKVEIVP